MSLPDLSAWLPQVLRITVFVDVADRAQQESWWESRMGKPPETRITRPAENIFQDEGAFEGGRFILNTQPGRADWIWSVNSLSAVGTGALPTLGSFSDGTKRLQALIAPWLDSAPPVFRLAFGAVLDQKVHGKEEAYSLLQQYLPDVKLDARNTSDFMYQLNRPVPSKAVNGLTVNRLGKWMSLRAAFQNIAPGGSELRSEFDLIRVEIDANTDHVKEPIEKKALPNLLTELVDAATRMAQQGDRS